MSNRDQPTNANFLSQLGFVFSVHKLPSVNFFVTRAIVPGFSLTPATVKTPFSTLHYSPDKMEYNQLAITFKVDEDMTNWIEMYNWCLGVGFPQTFDQYKNLAALNDMGDGIYSDGNLTILTSEYNPNIRFHFKSLVPTGMTDLDFTTQGTDVDYIEATVNFAYTYYTVEKV